MLLKTNIILSLIMVLDVFGYSENEALNEPFIMRLETETQYKLKEELDKALANKHWHRANDILYHETIQKKFGTTVVTTVDVEAAMEQFKKAADEGIVIAAWQAYNLGKTLTPNKGVWARATLPKFAEKLVDFGICQGYMDLGNFKGRGWNGERRNFSEAVRILLEGEKVCNREEAPSWQKKQWAALYYKYKTLKEYPEALKCKK